MRFGRSARVAITAFLFLLAGLLAAPAAFAKSSDKPSSDAPWLIGILVVVVLALAAVGLLVRRRVGKSSGTDFRR
jgi:membrane protein DedA with SNARE-associated domain